MRMRSLVAMARGARAAARDPKVLARLPGLLEKEKQARRHEALAKRAFGGLPRCVPIDRLLSAGPSRLSKIAFLDDSSTVLDLLLLQSLASRFRDCRYFEIGTFRGESAIAVAEAAGQVVTLSLSDEAMLEMGQNRSFVAAHRAFSAGHPRVAHVFGDSRTFDISTYRGWADLLFVDGNHTFDFVVHDTERYWSLRRGEDSIVVWHDAFFSPLEPRWEVLAGIAAGLPEKYRSGLVHVSNTMCAAWLPDADQFPTVARDYMPRIAFSVALELCPELEPERAARNGA